MVERRRLERWEKVVAELCRTLETSDINCRDMYDYLLGLRKQFGSFRGKNLRLIVSALSYVYLSERGILNSNVKQILKDFAKVSNFKQICSVLSDLNVKRDSMTVFKNVVSSTIMRIADDRAEEALKRFEEKLQNATNLTLSKIATAGYESLVEIGIKLTKTEFARAIGVSHQIIA